MRNGETDVFGDAKERKRKLEACLGATTDASVCLRQEKERERHRGGNRGGNR